RIEDTDRERSTPEAIRVILDGLKWLGLSWDGEVVYQSARESRHLEIAHRLLAEGRAYRCYCTKEELEAMRAEQRARGEKPRYDGRCRHRTDAPAGRPFVIRFKAPQTGETIVQDRILGEVRFANAELDDLVLVRSDGTPTYNLAVVVDDHDMGITHVIRGADHLNNTPRQIQIYEALGWDVPAFAHIPLILGPDGAKMSKRHGAVAITAYRDEGFLPEAMVNFLARLGWAHGDQETFTVDELVQLFDLDAVGKANARFDLQKLLWLNGWHMRRLPDEVLAERLKPFLARVGVDEAALAQGPALVRVVPQLKERAKTLVEMAELARPFYRAPDGYDEKAVKKHLKGEWFKLVEAFVREAKALSEQDWTPEALHRLLVRIAEAHGVGLGKVAQPIRILLTGRAVSPPIDATLALIGHKEAIRRLEEGLRLLAPA
ncbi:MAG: glutamate--tRNA ligase, partial [Zetaproteobacteria bacterium]